MPLNSENRRRLGLMEWLVEQGDGLHEVAAAPGYVGLANAYDRYRDDVKHLASRDYVKLMFEGGMKVRAETTADGRAWVEEIQRQRNDKIARRWAARSGIVQWLDHAGADAEGKYESIELFCEHELADFFGQPLGLEEVETAAAFLKENGLIEGITVDGGSNPVRAYLTSRGLDCIEQNDGDVRAYLTAPQGGFPLPNVTISNVTGNIQMATGPGSRQHLEVHQNIIQNHLEVEGLVEILRLFGVVEAKELEPLYEAAVAGLIKVERSEEPLLTFRDRALALAGTIGTAAGTAAVSSLVTTIVANAHLIHG